ncbi:bifunctional AARP2CN/Ribosome biogenesis protein BMS1-TSR1 [Babesia duncani]|uniref:Bifunctional AARP2CN/Ribosome biogenesis protein BMS1-TSR1 n=2 Tax=Babesia duncani TaxID=323732 RepID=A0AAD9UMB3_9APIC|nr:bifunctional AARP2CN/Ribosome biogenesis protein BMS1-TSR1 [Babesia duncani]KAK2197979.1 bifunctional AARP2CN/Ribosome biogenesis protein BMS1-TSR1 [Babesia duncani]
MDRLYGSDSQKKSHQKSRAKPKLAKKHKKELERKGIHSAQAKHNPKGFTFGGGYRAAHRRFQHASEVEQRRLRAPQIHKNPNVPPPLVVIVQGPAGVGKSTLIASIVKYYAGRNVACINGPITLVIGRNRRITLIECGNSLVDMIDCCKIADLALVMINGSIGFEMETFEFVNLMQTHGVPRIMGIVSHLDSFSDNKTLRRTKKILKKRFWTEIHDGAKMLHLGAPKYGRYRNNDTSNLGRILANVKPPNISWRLAHLYCICLRHEYDYEKQDGNLVVYGYIYGTRAVQGQRIHIPGAGDCTIDSIVTIDDPCPVQLEGRTLKDKNRNIYAPYCDIGTVMLDQDAMYIQLVRAREHFTRMENEGPISSEAVAKVRELQESTNALARNLEGVRPTLFPPRPGNDAESGHAMESWGDGGHDDSGSADDDQDDQDDERGSDVQGSDDSGSVDDDWGDEAPSGLRMTDEAPEGYSGPESDTDSESELGNVEGAPVEFNSVDKDETFWLVYHAPLSTVHARDGNVERNGHVDYSLGSSLPFQNTWDSGALESLRAQRFINYTDEYENDGDEQPKTEEMDFENEKVARMAQETQDKDYNEALMLNANGNVGQFVRMVISGVDENYLKSRATFGHPIIIGGLQPLETSMGYMQLKLKRHRWSPRILKTNDPLLFSIGWRRFQALPTYCMQERNELRNRMLKYTPEHMHCLANIYGPLAPPASGMLAIRQWDRIAHFRISATGVVIGTNQAYTIQKKLKLLGEPYKINKNTAFIRNMFNSELEVTKCLGAKLQTASGIRGQIKKPEGQNGNFRATFEDKILQSDLVILKCYTKVETMRACNLMLDSDKFIRIRSQRELKPLDPAQVKGHDYERKSELSRPTRRFNEIKIPKPLLEKLPFGSRPKIYAPQESALVNAEYSQRDVKVANLLQRLTTIRKERLERRMQSQKLYRAKQQLESESLDETRAKRLREIKRARNIRKSRQLNTKRSRMHLD